MFGLSAAGPDPGFPAGIEVELLLLLILAIVLSVFSLALSVRAVAVWCGRPREPFSECPEAVAVTGVPEPGKLEPATLRAVAAANGKVRIDLAVGTLENDLDSIAVIDSVRREFPGLRAVAVPLAVDHRKVIEAGLALGAATLSPGDPVMVLASGARPSTPSIRRLCLACPGDRVYSAVPSRHPSGGGLFSAESDMARMTPLYYAMFGPAGVPAVLSSTSRSMIDKVAADPLSANMPSGGAALHRLASPRDFVLVEAPVSPGAGFARQHLTMLSRLSVPAFVAYCVSLAAGPFALLLTSAGVFGGGLSVAAMSALLISIVSRALQAATWPARCFGVSSAMLDALVSPVSDLPALARAVASASRRTVKSGRASYVMHSKGLMSPAMDRGSAMGGIR